MCAARSYVLAFGLFAGVIGHGLSALGCEPSPFAAHASGGERLLPTPCWMERPDILYDWLHDIPRAIPKPQPIPTLYPATHLPGGTIGLPQSNGNRSERPSAQPLPNAANLPFRPQLLAAPDGADRLAALARPTPQFLLTAEMTSDFTAHLSLSRTVTQARPENASQLTWEMISFAENWMLFSETDWPDTASQAGVTDAFATQLNLEMHCVCFDESQPVAYRGNALMHFNPTTLQGEIAKINLTATSAPALAGHLALQAESPYPGVFRDRDARLSLGPLGDPELWHADVAFHVSGDSLTTAPRGGMAAVRTDSGAMMIANFHPEIVDDVPSGAAN